MNKGERKLTRSLWVLMGLGVEKVHGRHGWLIHHLNEVLMEEYHGHSKNDSLRLTETSVHSLTDVTEALP